MDKIGSTIDAILNKQIWTEKETNFYKLLEAKLAKYKHRIEFLKDRDEIVTNIQQQQWFLSSAHKVVINGYLNEMEIESFTHKTTKTTVTTKIVTKFIKSKFRFVCDFDLKLHNNMATGLDYRMYVEDYDTIKQGFIAYNNPTDTTEVKLPQTREIVEIMKTDIHVPKMEIIKMFAEIVIYFDESQYIAKTPLGRTIPMNLTYFLMNL